MPLLVIRQVLIAVQSAALRKLVPALVPPFGVHPPLVWIPIARLLPSTITGLPELPPCVSGLYRKMPEDAPPVFCDSAPAWVC